MSMCMLACAFCIFYKIVGLIDLGHVKRICYYEPTHSEGDQPWDFFGGNDAEAENSSTLATSCEELTHWKRL